MQPTYVRPGFLLSHIANPINRHLGIFPVLTVIGRTSGRPRSLPIGAPLEFEGARYLVSARGETNWVRNLRHTRRGELTVHGRHEVFQATEVTGAARARVIAAYRRRLGRSGDRLFSAIPNPARHAVFRIETLPA
jgi:deazaflavin-dependent oxidoreductase (nitroreductase family)